MKFLIITNVVHIKKNDQYFGYAPYVAEMNIWLKHVDQLIVVAPLFDKNIKEIDLAYECKNIKFNKVPDFSFTTIKSRIFSCFKIPIIFWKVFLAMRQADHIHLRCPGNIGLIGCFVQFFFPNKIKTAKYAGNWDPESKQPWTYRLQKYILSNVFLTKNIQVLVYGNWDKQSKNIKPFFTATYSEAEKIQIEKTSLNLTAKFVFVGSLVVGKSPMYAIQLIQELEKRGNNVILNLYGDGVERAVLENYIKENHLDKIVFLNGNQTRETVKKAYQESHFVILPSKSEGWPKAIAEGMFWNCIPISTKVSCVPYMLDYGKRGILLEMNLEKDLLKILSLLNDKNFNHKSRIAASWSQCYTTEIFESEIKRLLIK